MISEDTATRGQAPQLESRPYSLQLEKARMQQRRPNAAKNKQINKPITLAAQLMTDYKREADKLVKEYRGYPGEKVSVAQSRVVARGARKRHSGHLCSYSPCDFLMLQVWIVRERET